MWTSAANSKVNIRYSMVAHNFLPFRSVEATNRLLVVGVVIIWHCHPWDMPSLKIIALWNIEKWTNWFLFILEFHGLWQQVNTFLIALFYEGSNKISTPWFYLTRLAWNTLPKFIIMPFSAFSNRYSYNGYMHSGLYRPTCLYEYVDYLNL